MYLVTGSKYFLTECQIHCGKRDIKLLGRGGSEDAEATKSNCFDQVLLGIG